MNLTRLAILFVLITFPFTVISYVDVLALQKEAQLEIQYRHIINNAVSDARVALKQSANYRSEEGDAQVVTIDAEAVVQSFLETYHLGFNAHSRQDEIKVDQHILGLLVVAYDGYYIYGTQEVTDSDGNVVTRPVLSEKKPYLFEGANHVVQCTLGQEVTVINRLTWAIESGPVDGLSDLPPEITLSDFSDFRQGVITDVLTASMEQTVNVHNAYVAQLGMAYDFYLPRGEGSSLRQSISEVGLMVFVQGHPLGKGKYLDMTSFSQGQLKSEDKVTGYKDGSGQLYYCSDEHHGHSDSVIKIFSNAREAAGEGYWPCMP